MKWNRICINMKLIRNTARKNERDEKRLESSRESVYGQLEGGRFSSPRNLQNFYGGNS